jgi:mono/diheme cytochrome c family protein
VSIRSLLSTIVLVVPFCPLAGCHKADETAEDRGHSTFLRSCAPCHGANGKGTKPAGFTTFPRNLTDPNLQERLSDDAMRDTVHYGKGQMPPFGAALSDADIDDVVRYVRTLKHVPPPR